MAAGVLNRRLNAHEAPQHVPSYAIDSIMPEVLCPRGSELPGKLTDKAEQVAEEGENNGDQSCDCE
jgi:hypothetical protein